MGKLTALQVQNLKRAGRFGDGGGLYLRIAPGGSKQFIQRIVINGKRRDLGLGPWPLVSLREAREKSFEIRRAVFQGHDVMGERRREKTPTFAEAAERTHAALSPRWKNEKGKAVWMQRLRKHVFPHLGSKRVDEISRGDVISALAPIWAEKRETARKTRQYVNAVFQWCLAHNFIANNPANYDEISAALPKMPAARSHMRSIDYRELPEVMGIVEASGASPAVKLCFAFVVYTAARGNEARGALWSEIDIERKLWCIPPTRMKGGKEHRQPLSDEALAVLERTRALDDGSGLCFPSPQRKGRPLSDMAMMKMIRDLNLAEKMTIHGLRASFRSWCADTGQPREIAEAALAHSTGSAVEQAYIRSDMLQRRRRLMQSWTDYLAGNRGGKVIRANFA